MKKFWSSFKNDQTFRAKIIVNVVLFMGIMAIAFPIILASSMTFYIGDDFGTAGTIYDGKKNIIELFIGSWVYTKDRYFNWQGTYFSMFIQYLIHPLFGGNLLQLRIIMILNSLLFLVGTGVFIWGIFKTEICHPQYRLLLILCCFLGVFGFEMWDQVFYWYTGATAYTMPCTLVVMALSIITLSNKKSSYVIAGILLFCASGGTLTIAAMGCSWMLMMVISRFMKRKLRKRDLAVLSAAVVGALVNSLAPGNFVRHDVIDDSGLHFFRAIIYSVNGVITTMEWLFFDTPFVIVVMVSITIGIVIGKKQSVDKTYAWIMIAVNAVIPIVTYFPVCLGYSDTRSPNRCKFILTLVLVISVIIVSVFVGKIVACYLKADYMRKIIGGGAILLLIMMPIERDGWKISSLIPYKTMMELTEGNIQSYYRDVNRIYDAISKDKNDDVFIYSLPEANDFFFNIGISEDPQYLLNVQCAKWFCKKSIQYVPQPVYVGADGKIYVRIAPSYLEEDLSFVSVFINSDMNGIKTVQILQPFEKNMVLEIPKDETGTVAVYVFANEKGDEVLEKLEISF